MCHEQIEVPISIRIAARDSHACFGLAGCIHSGAESDRLILKCSVMLVDP